MSKHEDLPEQPVVDFTVSIHFIISKATMYTLTRIAVATLISIIVTLLGGTIHIF